MKTALEHFKKLNAKDQEEARKALRSNQQYTSLKDAILLGLIWHKSPLDYWKKIYLRCK